MKVSDEEMALNQIPLYARDRCAHLLIELRRCYRKEYYLPWECKNEKHKYEACLVQEYQSYTLPSYTYSDSSVIRRQKLALREKLTVENAPAGK